MKVFYVLVISIIMMINLQLLAREDGIRSTYMWHQRLNALQVDMDKVASKNELLLADIKDLKNNQSSIEEYARFELGMIKSGEHYIQLIN